jgi:hypothetical protein
VTGVVFTGDSVRAMLDGRKTQTRRLFSLVHADDHLLSFDGNVAVFGESIPNGHAPSVRRVRWRRGVRYWVKETWGLASSGGYLVDPCLNYRADGAQLVVDPRELRLRVAAGTYKHRDGWRSPMMMYRWASRITIEVTRVRIQRLQAITERDARAEGVDRLFGKYVPAYAAGWESINGRRAAWNDNPWIQAVTFKVVEVKARAAA